MTDDTRAAPAASPEALREELDRLIRRVAALGPARLGAPSGGGSETRAAAVHQFAQRLADATAQAEGEPARQVPRLADHATADQLTVLTQDLLRVADGVPGPHLADLCRAATELRRRV